MSITCCKSAGNVIGYEDRLFDTSRVHTIEIVMDDWDGFIKTCRNEEYSVCSVVIDGESCKNAGIRAKGNEDLENVLDMEAVLRYFVVQNFVVNGDSYTGNMIHNYYLYEEDGRLSMIPWDYNLALGSFTGGEATLSVNDAIDDVLSDRPMQAWIFPMKPIPKSTMNCMPSS